jgi:large subunit ribosomal protein L16
MLQPKKQKYRKHFRGSMKGVRESGSYIEFGSYGLKSLGRGWLSARQIEAGRKVISHYTKRAGKLWIRVFPDKSYTKKPSGAGMGSGKGEIEGYVVPIRPGRIIYELSGIEEEIAFEALKRAGAKLPFKTKVIIKE